MIMATPETFASDTPTPQTNDTGARRLFSQSPLDVPRRIVAAGEAIHPAHAPADHVYFIDRGEVRLYQPGPDGTARLVEILGPGDWFGVAALAGSVTCEKSAIAITNTAIAQIPLDQFLAVLERDPQSSVLFLRDLARRLHAARTATSRFVFDDCERRILKTLVDFSRTAAASPTTGNEVALRITHQQLAQAIGVARETVSLALTKLRRQNLVQTGRNRLVFNPLMLQEFMSRGAAQ
ncbi:MAG TPA: Crp/Fnr family transcriptional regulator [Tepidisphaeraceae bacterium]|nr:Crp/Fnr family transcriptional regulator [Tepidisphaeraceae bacterium]